MLIYHYSGKFAETIHNMNSAGKIFRIIVILFALSALCGCIRNAFRIEVALADDFTHTYRVQYYAAVSDGGRYVESAIPVSAGKGEIEGATRYPTIVYLFDSGEMPVLIFYAERGDKIKITGKGTNPAAWDVGGNEVNEAWSKWRHDNLDALEKRDPQEINKAVAAYVKANPATKLATLLMLTTYNRREDEKGYLELWNAIPEKFKSPELLKAVGRPDQFTSDILPPDDLGSLRLHAFRDTVITLDSKVGKITLLWFRRSENNLLTDEVKDSLRSLHRTFGDSSKLRIAEIAFEPDTVTWVREVLADSTGWIHAIVPAAEASEDAMRLQVGRTPFFIVADKAGRQRYRGSDLKAAVAEARKLVSKEKSANPRK